MQSKSIYHPTYKPLFVNEIKKDDIKDFSNNLSNKLRQIKLAISKANMNINKKPKKKEEAGKNTSVSLRNSENGSKIKIVNSPKIDKQKQK